MGIDTSGGSPHMDYAEHTRTYQGFLKATGVLLAAIVVLLAGMAFFLL